MLRFLATLFVAMGLSVPTQAQNIPIQNVAGGGYLGGFSGDGGPATQAKLNSSTRGSFDRHGNFYFADGNNNRIRKIDTSGIISTVAGNGLSGFSGDGGHSLNASLAIPVDVVVDTIGNLFIADLGNGRIRKVSPDGTITTIAGCACPGSNDPTWGNNGPAISAVIRPLDLEISPQGEVYFSSDTYTTPQYNHSVRKITSDGRVVTVSHAPFVAKSIAFNRQGQLFAADLTKIYAISKDGQASLVAGGGTMTANETSALETKINDVQSMDFDVNDILYFTDTSEHRVRYISKDGLVRTLASGIAYPKGVQYRPGSAGGLYIVSSLYVFSTTQTVPYAGPFQPVEALIDDTNQRTSGLDSDIQGCSYGCNPVDLVSGAKLDYEVDYQNQSAFPIVLERRYDSRSGKWIFGYERRVHRTATGTAYKAHLYRPDGSTISFQRTSISENWNPAEATYLGTLSDTATGGIRYLNLQNVFENYNSDGVLVSLENTMGNKVRFSYNSLGHLTHITDDFGRALTITKTEDLTSTSMAFWDGTKTVSYLFERGIQDKPLLKRVTHEDGTYKQYLYDEGGTPGKGLLTGIIAEDGTRYATYTYDEAGTVASTQHGNGQDFTVYTIQPGQSASVSWENGSSTFPLDNPTPGSESKTRGSSVPCPNCGGASVPQISYNSQGVPTSFTSYEGIQTSRTVNPRGLPETEIYASNTSRKTTTNYTWHPSLRLPLTIEQEVIAGFSPSKLTTSFTYDGSNRLTGKTDSTNFSTGGIVSSRTITWTYNNKGQVLTETNGATGTTAYTYDPTSGNLLTSTNALGHVTTYGDYNPKGQPGTIVEPNGLHTFFEYNARGQTTYIRTGASIGALDISIMSITYTPTGQVKRINRPDGSWVEYDYDTAQRLVTITDPRGRIEQTLNNDGDVVSQEMFNTNGQLIQAQTHSYDHLRQLRDRIDANNNKTTISRNPQTQQIVSISDPDLPGVEAWSQGYDSLQQPETQTTGSAQQERTTWTQHDRTGQLAYAIDGNGVYTGYGYNGFGEVWFIDSSDAGTKGFSRDSGGRIHQSNDGRGAFAQKQFDAIGRVTQVTHSVDAMAEVEIQSMIYDTCLNGIGRLCQVTDHSGTTTYNYDLWGKTTEKTFTPAGTALSFTTVYTYNRNGQLISMLYPSGKRSDYTYTQGALTRITYDFQIVVNNVGYRPFSEQVTGWTWGSTGTQSVISYDLNGRISRIQDVDDRVYTRNNKGWITSITDPINPNANQSYVYNQTGFLKEATLAARPDPIVYGVDNNDNMESKSVGPLPEDVQQSDYLTNLEINNRPATHQQGQGPTYSPLFDGAGNMTDDGDGLTLVYDAKGRVRSSERRGIEANYAYNALGQRMRKSDNTLSTGHRFYVYDEAGRVLGEYDGTGKALEEYVYLDGNRPVAVARNLGLTQSPDIYPILTDHLGTPRKILNPYGILVWSWDAKDPYGYQAPNELESGTVFTFDLRFPGQRYDKQTGLFHNGFRDYDSKLGRYVQADPLGLEGGWNHYSYANADPINSSDSTGLIIDGEAFQSPQFRQALAYLSQSPIAATIIKKVSESQRVMVLNVTNDMQDSYEDVAYFNISYTWRGKKEKIQKGPSIGGIIRWDPTAELYCLKTGKAVSPALQLLHEMVHFLQYEDRQAALQTRAGTEYNNKQWKNGLEHDAIVSNEAIAAFELGEMIRNSHTFSRHDPNTHDPIEKIYGMRRAPVHPPKTFMGPGTMKP